MTSVADFLVELGTEELPPKALLTLRDAFRDGIVAALDSAGLSHGDVLAYATPRRLAVIVNGLQTEQPTQQIDSRGPPISVAYKDGQPTKAAEAFAAKNGVTLAELTTVKTDKGEWLHYSGEIAGAKASDLLPEIVATSLAALPIPKRMRWGNNSVEFVRPAHWLVMLLGKDVVDAEILGLAAGRVTFGHRFHAPDGITLQSPDKYRDELYEHGRVIADFAERRSLIVAAAKQAAEEVGGTAILEPAVVDEVTALVEWPVPCVGQFNNGFLRLPPEVLTSTLQDHQRYFPVAGDQGLKPMFIAFSNIASKDMSEVQRGNERVVLPRLADAAFFWDQDSARPLAERIEALKSVVYQKGLGSLYDKSQRVAQLAGLVAGYLEDDVGCVNRAAELSRTDLLTAMVGEFPELQGRMGFYYALHDGEPNAVAVALQEQYMPRHAGDDLPASSTGQALSLADRLDTLAGIFALGKRPSGNKDPFGLRRQALAIVRILIECNIDVDLPSLLASAIELQPVDCDSDVADELYGFIMDRMRTWYIAGQAPDFAPGDVTAEMFEAVLSRAPESPLDFHARLLAVYRFMALDEAVSLAAANKRIANILKKAESAKQKIVVEELFDGAAEKTLFDAVQRLLPGHKLDLDKRNYQSALKRLAELREPVDGYFDEVMVMTDDSKQRANRIAQLEQIRRLFLDVADISCIPSAN
jgi:glycyl-tRNA synthetase beta chain